MYSYRSLIIINLHWFFLGQIIFFGLFLWYQDNLILLNFGDTDSYLLFNFSSLKEILGNHRTLGLPLIIKFYDLFVCHSADSCYELWPIFQLVIYLLSVLFVYSALIKYGFDQVFTFILLTTLLWSFNNEMFHYICTEPLTGAFLNCVIGFFILSLFYRTFISYLLLSIFIVFLYLLRPAFVFVTVLVPIWAAFILFINEKFEPIKAAVIFFKYSLISILPLILFCFLRFVIVGHFGIVSFSGFGLAGHASLYLNEENINLLSGKTKILANEILIRKRKLSYPSNIAPFGKYFDDNYFYPDDFTIDMWVNVIKGGDRSFYVSSNSKDYFALNYSKSDTQFNLYFNSPVVSETIEIDLIGWNHIAWVRNESTLTLYVNGESVHSVLNSGNLGFTSSEITINQLGGGTYFTEHYLEEVRISKGVARWTNNFIPPRKGAYHIDGSKDSHIGSYDENSIDSNVILYIHSDNTDRYTNSLDFSQFGTALLNWNGVEHKSTGQIFGATSIYFRDASKDILHLPNTKILGESSYIAEFKSWNHLAMTSWLEAIKQNTGKEPFNSPSKNIEPWKHTQTLTFFFSLYNAEIDKILNSYAIDILKIEYKQYLMWVFGSSYYALKQFFTNNNNFFFILLLLGCLYLYISSRKLPHNRELLKNWNNNIIIFLFIGFTLFFVGFIPTVLISIPNERYLWSNAQYFFPALVISSFPPYEYWRGNEYSSIWLQKL